MFGCPGAQRKVSISPIRTSSRSSGEEWRECLCDILETAYGINVAFYIHAIRQLCGGNECGLLEKRGENGRVAAPYLRVTTGFGLIDKFI